MPIAFNPVLLQGKRLHRRRAELRCERKKRVKKEEGKVEGKCQIPHNTKGLPCTAISQVLYVAACRYGRGWTTTWQLILVIYGMTTSTGEDSPVRTCPISMLLQTVSKSHTLDLFVMSVHCYTRSAATTCRCVVMPQSLAADSAICCCYFRAYIIQCLLCSVIVVVAICTFSTARNARSCEDTWQQCKCAGAGAVQHILTLSSCMTDLPAAFRPHCFKSKSLLTNQATRTALWFLEVSKRTKSKQ